MAWLDKRKNAASPAASARQNRAWPSARRANRLTNVTDTPRLSQTGGLQWMPTRPSTPTRLLLSVRGGVRAWKYTRERHASRGLHANAGSTEHRAVADAAAARRRHPMPRCKTIRGSATTKYCLEPSAAPSAMPDAAGRPHVTAASAMRAAESISVQPLCSIMLKPGSAARSRNDSAAPGSPRRRRNTSRPQTARAIHDTRFAHLGSPPNQVLDAYTRAAIGG